MSIERAARRAVRRARAKFSGKSKDRQIRAVTEAARKAYDLCRCADDVRHYDTHEDADNDRSPTVVCAQCGKDKLRVAHVGERERDGEQLSVWQKGERIDA